MTGERSDSSGRPRPSRLLLRPKHHGRGQQRASERTSTHRSVRVRLDDEEAVELDLLNISPTGLSLAAGAGLDAGIILSVETLPGTWRLATTRWSREEEQEVHIGAEWHEPMTFDEVWKLRAGQ